MHEAIHQHGGRAVGTWQGARAPGPWLGIEGRGVACIVAQNRALARTHAQLAGYPGPYSCWLQYFLSPVCTPSPYYVPQDVY